MKKQIVLGLGLAVLATPVLASRARLQALGEGTNGSYYIQDNRNIFLNAAEINNNKDLVTFEWGGNNGQGGVIKQFNNLVFGLHMNNGTSMAAGNDAALEADGIAAVTSLNPNSIDLFVGGDAGVKWGVNLTYVNGSDEAAELGTGVTADAESKAMDLNVGVQAGDIKAFVNYGVNGEATYKDIVGATSTKIDVDRDQDLTLGVAYQLNAYTIFGQYNMNEFTSKFDGVKASTEESSFQIGAGRQDRLNDRVTLFTKASYVKTDSEEKDTANAKTENNGWNVPVVIGLEAEATSWLAVRGSVAQHILSANEEKTAAAKVKSTSNDSTFVNVGASLRFGEFFVDGVLSNNANGKLNLDDVMSTVSMTYKF